MKKNIPTVVITSATRWTYFHWFLLGFYELKKKGKINLKFNISLKDRLKSNKYIHKLLEKADILKGDSYNLNGYVLYPNNTKKYFCIDSADSPYLFHSEDLEKANCYFKMQCPINLESDYFLLTDEIKIPWLDHLHEEENDKYFVAKKRGGRKICTNFSKNRHKIKPLMIGTRRLGTNIRYSTLKKGYENNIQARNLDKEKRIMCYFGNAKGPKVEKNVKVVDYDNETDIMSFYGNKISHPNEKRAEIAKIIATLGNDCDARVISQINSNIRDGRDKSLVIPLNKFAEYVSKFQYNYNVSGYRLSIPNRFTDSFMVGTGIITDKLSVRWYLPFDEAEVKETVAMGYKKINDIDWKKVKSDLTNMPKSNPQKIVKCFEEKWQPIKVVEYMLREIEKS